MKTICYYHANCFDGMAAAWVVKRKYPNAELISAQYGTSFFDYLKPYLSNWANPYDGFIEMTQIIVVDFSFPREQMEVVSSITNLLVLDHHKTTQVNCEGLSFCKFDMNQSGAGLAWRHFFPDVPVPNLIKYIEDRDLWRFKLPESKFINAFIQSYPINLESYEYLSTYLEDAWHEAVLSGEAIERYKNTMVEAICSHAKLEKIGAYLVPTVQSGILMSEIGHFMCNQTYSFLGNNKPAFAASWFIREDGVKVYSLRSIEDFDVSEIAKQYGGGGHRNAAGFQIFQREQNEKR